MGLRFRKSINIGKGFRLNLSNRGVGYSIGGKGLRYTHSPSRSRKKAKVQKTVTASSPKSRGVATVLCLFGGFFGLHRFYVGRIGSGVLYLLTAGGFVFGWLIDLFFLFAGNFKDKDGFPLR